MKTIYSTFITNDDLQDTKEFMINCGYTVNENTDLEYETSLLKDSYFDNFMSDLTDYYVKHPLRLYKLEGSLGLWNGKKNIIPLYDANLLKLVEKCINNVDDFEILEDRGRFIIKAHHHDGTNEFTIKIKDECNDYYKNLNLLKFMREEY